MAEFAALPLFTDAIMADCGHLTHEEFGIYMRVLILMWRTPGCSIPDDAEWISKRLSCDANAYALHIHPIMQEFCTRDAGRWFQKRLRKEHAYVAQRVEKRKAAAKARWEKSSTENIEENSMQMDNQMHMQATMQKASNADAPTPTPTPTPSIDSFMSRNSEKPPEQAPAPRKTGSRLPDDFKPDLDFAVTHGLQPQQALTEAAKFKDYWMAKTGQHATKLDWQATWRNWVREAASRNNRPSSQKSAFRQHQEAVHQNIERMARGEYSSPNDINDARNIDLEREAYRRD